MAVFVCDEAADYEACPVWAARCACPSVLFCWFGIPEAPAAAALAAAVAEPNNSMALPRDEFSGLVPQDIKH